MHYIEKDGKPVFVDDIGEWGLWMEKADRSVGKFEMAGVTVSTIFLGIDHAFGDGSPILYETMIFGGLNSEAQERYCTREEALKGHEKMVTLVKGEV